MSSRRAVFGALVAPVLWTLYLVAVTDPRLPEPLGPYHASLALWALYVAPAAGLGALAGWGLARIPATALVVPIALLGLPLLPVASPGSLFAVNYPALFLLVGLVLLGSVEFGVRNPARIRQIVTREAALVGLGVGIVHAALAVLLRSFVFGFDLGGRGWVAVGIGVWMLVGATLEAGIPGFLYARYSLVAPLLVVVGLFGWSAFRTWTYLQDLSASGAAMGVAFTPFTGYLVAWFAVLALALLAGGLEYAVSNR